MRDVVTTVLEIAGFVLVAVGAGMVAVPAGLVVGGLGLVLVGALLGRPPRPATSSSSEVS